MKRLLLTFLFLACGALPTHAGVDAKTIEFKDWPNGKPSVTVIRTRENSCTSNIALTSRARFVWVDTNKVPIPSMSALGRALLDRNGYDTDPNASGFGSPQVFAVRELALGDPDTVRKSIPVSGSAYDFQQEDLDAVPAGATKVMLLTTGYSHGNMRRLPHLLVIAFDSTGDEDLRRIAFEEGVTRHFCWRD